MAFREETSWRPWRKCPQLQHGRPTHIGGSPDSEARGLHWAGRQDPARTPLHSDQQGPRALPGLYLTPLCFNTNSPERNSSPFGGRGWWEEWSVLLGSLTLNPQGVGWAYTASMAREDGTKNDTVHGPVTRGRGLQLCRHLELSLVGCCPGPPKPRMMQRKKAEPQQPASILQVLCIQSRTPQGRRDSPWPPSGGKEQSLKGTGVL